MKTMFGKKKRLSSDMALQITSMADIFTILLVFLLKNYAASVSTTAPVKNTRLPVAETSVVLKDSLKLEISPDSLLVDEKPIIPLNNFVFPAGNEMDPAGKDTLSLALTAQREKQTDKQKEAHLVLIADEKAPYETVQRVLASAALTGYVDLQLVVVQKE